MSIMLFVGFGLLMTLAALVLGLSLVFGLRGSWLPWALAVSAICAAAFWVRAVIIFKHLASM